MAPLAPPSCPVPGPTRASVRPAQTRWPPPLSPGFTRRAPAGGGSFQHLSFERCFFVFLYL